AGDARQLDIEILWRSGKRSVVRNVEPNHVYEIAEAAATDESPKLKAQSSNPASPLFEDVSSRLKHIHVDAPFDDFARQPLLPRKLSSLGPGVCWADLDGDGHEDLVVAAGTGGYFALFRNDGK